LEKYWKKAAGKEIDLMYEFMDRYAEHGEAEIKREV